MKSYILFSFIVALTLISTCQENPTTNDDDNLNSGRDYLWTIDTIQSGSIQTYLTSLWGSSSQNVWASGYDADNSKCIYFF